MAYPGVWALSDSNANVVTPRWEFTDDRSQFFVVQATSPEPEKWKSWKQHREATFAIMNPWSWSEIYIGA